MIDRMKMRGTEPVPGYCRHTRARWKEDHELFTVTWLPEQETDFSWTAALFRSWMSSEQKCSVGTRKS